MCLIKRFVPFAVALVLGLFVASFFVTVAAPRFNFNRSNSGRKFREVRGLRYENQRLREELRQQKIKIAEMETRRVMNFNEDGETIMPIVPPAPARVR